MGPRPLRALHPDGSVIVQASKSGCLSVRIFKIEYSKYPTPVTQRREGGGQVRWKQTFISVIAGKLSLEPRMARPLARREKQCHSGSARPH